MSVPKDTTIAVVEAELEAVCAYSERHDLTVEWNPQELIVSVAGCHPANNDPIQFHADVSDYRAVAPAWTVTSSAKDHAFPKNGSLPNGKGSMFHGKGVICAHFNRLAYGQHGGPHKNWRGPDSWLQVRDHVYAPTLVEMLLQLVIHLKYSPGWK